MAVVSNGHMSDGFHIGMNMLQDRDREGIFLCHAEKPKGEWDLLLKVQKIKKKINKKSLLCLDSFFFFPSS